MLARLDAIRDLLVAPGNHAPLELAFGPDGALIACRAGAREFPVLGGKPVLLPHDSVVAAPLAARPRQGRLRAALAAFAAGTNRVAEENTRRVLAMLRERSGKRPRVLVIGGGEIGSGAGALYAESGIDLIGLDLYDSAHVQLVADGHALPVRDASVDAVWIQAVLEHVLEPPRVVAEIHRVLAAGGIVYAETPFMQQVHEGAFDFARFTESGQRWLFRRFDAVASGPIAGPGVALQWALRYFFQGLTRSRLAGTTVFALFFWLRFLDHVIPRRHAIDGGSAFFFLGTKRDAAMTPREAIEHYGGTR